MSRPNSEAMGDPDDLIAQVFREFREGLSERIDTLARALDSLEGGYDVEAAELFYRTAHSLKGAAPSFDADELVDSCSLLSELGLQWREAGFVAADELASAAVEIARLREAVAGYQTRMEGKGRRE